MLDTDEGMFKTTSDFGMSYLETPLETIPSFGERLDPPPNDNEEIWGALESHSCN